MDTSPLAGFARPTRRGAIFLFVLLGTLFPIGWLSTVNSSVAAVDLALFSTDLSHAIAHAILFFVLGLCAIRAFPVMQRAPWYFFVLMLLICVVQEAFQLGYKQRPIMFDEYRDVATDAIGFVVAFVVARLRMRQKQKAGSREE